MKTLHIVPGDSAGGSVLSTLREAGLDEEVLRFRDDLSCGPIDPDEPSTRAAWWAEVYESFDVAKAEAEERAFWKRVMTTDARLVVWFGRHAARELSFFLAWVDRVGDRPFQIIDVTGREVPVTRRDGSRDVYPAGYVATMGNEALHSLLGSERPITPEEQIEARRRWQKLRGENAPFRVVTEDGLVSAPIDYFDNWILGEAAADWKSLQRIILDAYGSHGDPYQQTGETMLRVRAVALVGEGKLVAHGDPWKRSAPIRLPGGSLPPPPKLLTEEILQRFEGLWQGKPPLSRLSANPLTRVVPGDIIHATSFGPYSIICVVASVEGGFIRARSIAQQLAIDFDIETGVGAWRDETFGDTPIECRVDSIEPLPREVHDALIDQDRRHRLITDPKRWRESKAAWSAWSAAEEHFKRHPLVLPKTGEA
jgi:hypothetical protein